MSLSKFSMVSGVAGTTGGAGGTGVAGADGTGTTAGAGAGAGADAGATGSLTALANSVNKVNISLMESFSSFVPLGLRGGAEAGGST